MPYDPRPVSKGGNRRIDEEFSRRAPPGMYRVVCVDTFDGSDWVHGDYNTERDALDAARRKGGEMLRTHVYDDSGHHVDVVGRF